MAKKRKAHVKTEYETLRGKYRAAAPRHVLDAEADMEYGMAMRTFQEAEILRVLSNRVTGTFATRLEQLMRTKRYRKLLSDYGYCKTRQTRKTCTKEERKTLEKRRKSIGAELTTMQKEFHITKDDVRKEMELALAKDGSRINSIFCLNAAMDIWQGIEKVLYGNGKRLHFKKRGEFPCIRAKQSNRGIVISADADGLLWFSVQGIGKFTLKLPEQPEDDLFLHEELLKVLDFMLDPEGAEQAAVARYAKTGAADGTFRPCYAQLVCKTIRGKMRVFVQLVIEGNPLPKKKKDGSPRHDFSKRGNVAADIGTQSVAAGSKDDMLLENLAERNYKSTMKNEAKERRRLRKLDRSRRAMNPENYNPDGTIKPKKDRKPWKYSKTYQRTLYHHKEEARKNAESRKYANRELANHLREMGDTIYTETKNAEKLKRKAKVSKVVVTKDGRTKNTKRKRFGHSIQHRCPGGFQAELKRKFGEARYHEVPKNYRASQYDHTADKYIKKELSDRMFKLSDGTLVQRDLYSMFLMLHPCRDGTHPSRSSCKKDFKRFLEMQNALIAEIKASGRKVCNSGIK